MNDQSKRRTPFRDFVSRLTGWSELENPFVESGSVAMFDSEEEVAGVAASPVRVIDVRTHREWNRGHVPGAVHIPHLDIVERIGEVTEDRDARIVLYCGVGQRADLAKAELEAAGYRHVENGGGYEEARRRFG